MGVDVTSPTSPGNSPSLSKSTSSRVSEKGPRAIQLGDRKPGGEGSGGGGVRFDPSVSSSLSLSLRLDGPEDDDDEEPMMIGVDEPGKCVCVRVYCVIVSFNE